MKKNGKLIAYLAGYCILALALAATQPLTGDYAPPDEVSRYLVPQYIYSRGILPTGLEEAVRIPAYGFSYMLYNAFPYIVMGLAMQAVGLFTSSPDVLLFAARLVNVLSGLAMAYVVWLLSRLLFRRERDRWLFCLAVTFQPMNLFVHSYVNTDSFCLLSTALIVYALVLQHREGTTKRVCCILSSGVILCALSYYSAYGYILAAAVLFVLSFVRPKPEAFDGKNFLKYASFTAVLVLIGAGWWFVRQGIVLNGDFLGLRTRAEMTASFGVPEVQQTATFAGQGYSFFGMLGEMFRRNLPVKMAGTLIAAYGPLSVRPPVWYYALYALVWGVGLIGCLAVRIRMRKNHEKRPWRWRVFHGAMIFCVILPLILFLRYCYTTDYQEQGRYLLPALIPAMMYVTRGTACFPKQVSAACSAAVVFCAAYQVFAVALPVFT